MFENFSNDMRLGEESHHAEGTAAGAQKRVELEDPANQICPASPQCLLSGGADGGLIFSLRVQRRNDLIGRLAGLQSSSANDVGVVCP